MRELVSCDGQITARQAAINAGYSSSSASSRAYEMMNPNISPHVCKEIEAYRAELDRVYEVGYKRHIRALGEIKQQALDAGAYSAAVMAEYRRAKHRATFTLIVRKSNMVRSIQCPVKVSSQK